MGQANDSITVTPGSGATVATHLVNGKEHQVVILANSGGQIVGDAPTYTAWSGAVTASANAVYMHVFNASGSGKIIKVRKMFIQPSQAAVVGVSQTWRVSQTSAVGTTGNTAITIRAHDSTDAALPAQITAARAFTAGGTDAFTYFEIGLNPEETFPAVGLMPFFNILPVDGDYVSDYVLNEGQGLKLTNITGLSYSYSVLCVFSVE
jgi:hypothetical protein